MDKASPIGTDVQRGIAPALVSAMRVPFLCLSLALTVAADARIGETPIQFADRYGRPKDTNLTAITDKTLPLIEGAVHHTYEYQGWKIRAAFLQIDGPCIRMDFQKTSAAVSGIVIRDNERVTGGNNLADRRSQPLTGLIERATGSFSSSSLIGGT
jgi:hypothetical protein